MELQCCHILRLFLWSSLVVGITAGKNVNAKPINNTQIYFVLFSFINRLFPYIHVYLHIHVAKSTTLFIPYTLFTQENVAVKHGQNKQCIEHEYIDYMLKTCNMGQEV